jgi:hypothetical protein
MFDHWLRGMSAMSHTKSDEEANEHANELTMAISDPINTPSQAVRPSEAQHCPPLLLPCKYRVDQKQHHSIQSESKGQCHRPERRGFAEFFRRCVMGELTPMPAWL